jgi:hypothetical protein
LDQRIEQYLERYEEIVERLDGNPGGDRLGPAILLADIGPDMSHLLELLVSGQLRKRGQTAEWANAEREPLAAADLLPDGLGGDS